MGPVELRDAGRTLYGTLITEGRAASGGRAEVFTPGSVEWPSVGVGILTAHRAAPEVRATPERQSDGRITIAARATDAIRQAVASGKRFMSVEFHALAERTTAGGVREVLRALVPDVALVESPEYDSTGAEIRRRGRRIRGAMPLRQPVACRCSGPDCDTAAVERIASGPEVLAYLADYSKPLGRAVANIGREEVAVGVEVVGGVSYADDLLETIRGGLSPIIRPYPDPELSKTRKEGRTLVYERLETAGWIVTWTDKRAGFTPATVVADAENRRGGGRLERRIALEAPTTIRRRARTWL